MLATPELALLAVARVVAVAVALQTIETWCIRRSAADDGVWRWATVRRELDVFPRAVQRALDALLGYASLRVLLVARLVAAIGVLALGPHPALFATLLATTLLCALRWRGSVNGGSDFMTLVVLTALTVASASGRAGVRLGCVWYVAIQACNSYFVAGVVKLKAASWRQGRALPAFLAVAVHDDARLVTLFARHPELARAASYAVIALECGFPVALVHPAACVAVVTVATAFHAANVYVFGLNRFLWAWAATYPALYYCSHSHLR